MESRIKNLESELKKEENVKNENKESVKLELNKMKESNNKLEKSIKILQDEKIIHLKLIDEMKSDLRKKKLNDIEIMN